MLGGKLTDDAVDDVSALTIERYPLSLMIRDALDLLHDLTVDDAAHVVLARALDAPLVAADTKLTSARRLGVDLRVLRVTTQRSGSGARSRTDYASSGSLDSPKRARVRPRRNFSLPRISTSLVPGGGERERNTHGGFAVS